MQKDEDYDFAIVKIPRKDKNGKDITGDMLGGGGRHRKNGTMSGMAYDFEIIDKNRLSNVNKNDGDLELSTKDIRKVAIIENFLRPAVNYFFGEIEYHVEIFLEDKVFSTAKKKGKKLIEDAKPIIAGIKDGIVGKETKVEQILKELETKETELVISNPTVKNTEKVKSKLDESNVEYVSSEEEKRIKTNMRCYAILLANEIQKYSKICVVKNIESKEYIDKRREFERLMTQDTMNGIQSLLENKEQFCLDNMAIRILSEFRAGNVILEGERVPIPDFGIIDSKQEYYTNPGLLD